ncbi:PREDICTED: DNA-directed RNA polymerase I subunit RPA49-like isoform X2 [Amphimedon queenslandica]|nr:PREDICTED: DNA-directed RNA polymerase I subunit RPA49-like isoform X2 [Amphimedon queenslandica]XP_019858967.1 PREDICTED: DNA-directed RNA polymerase I subunit RPA49-like isoform X2 [Amphimedon queenslandica]|eukprot:XP_019858966.1 PREDICTED: DNA-directed RNA polymerase I subunit RPA49-like isoform X2 [Amphimedon queenslandica]
MVGVLDKETGTMELHNTDIFHMTPYIKGKTDTPVTDPNPSKRKAISKEEYSEGLEKVMMSFGSSRAKKAWSAAKRNHIDSLRLEETLAPAVSHIETEMDKTMNELDDVPEQTVQTNPYLPVCNTDAATPDEVYLLNDLISTEEMKLLKSTATSLIEGKTTLSGTLVKEEERSQFLLTNFSMASSSTVRPVELVSMLFYCDYLITLYKSSPKTVQRFGLQKCSSIPHFMHSSLLDKFTEGGGGGRAGAKGAQGSFSSKMKDKVMSYLFAIALRFSGYTLNSSVLQKDLQISSNKVMSMFRVLGCSVSLDKSVSSGLKQYNITLKVPPVFPTSNRKKRKL